MNKFSISLLIFTALALGVGFQNCTKGTGESNSPSFSSGNGSGYDGKIYAHLADQLCSDGSLIDSKIQIRNSKAYLIRESCVDIAPALQTVVPVSFPPLSPSVLIYNGKVYHERIVHIDDTASSASGERLLGGHGFSLDGQGKLVSMIGFIASYDSQGIPKWMKQSSQLKDNFLITGASPAGGYVLATSRIVGVGAGLFRISESGVAQWAKKIDRAPILSSGFWLNATATDSLGNIYVAGGLSDSSSLSAGAFVLKFDSNGSLLWMRTVLPEAATVAGPLPHPMLANLHVISANNILLSGNLKGVPFIARFTDSGVPAWSKQYAGFRPGIASIGHADGSSTIALTALDSASTLLLDLNLLGQITSSYSLRPPAGYTGIYVTGLTSTSGGVLTAFGSVTDATSKRGIIVNRAAGASSTITSQWSVNVGSYSPIYYPKMGSDGVIWASIHMPFNVGTYLTSVLLRVNPLAPVPTCDICAPMATTLAIETAPASVAAQVFTDMVLIATDEIIEPFVNVAPGTFEF